MVGARARDLCSMLTGQSLPNMERSLTLYILMSYYGLVTISLSYRWPSAQLLRRCRTTSHFWHKSLRCHKSFCCGLDLEDSNQVVSHDTPTCEDTPTYKYGYVGWMVKKILSGENPNRHSDSNATPPPKKKKLCYCPCHELSHNKPVSLKLIFFSFLFLSGLVVGPKLAVSVYLLITRSWSDNSHVGQQRW